MAAGALLGRLIIVSSRKDLQWPLSLFGLDIGRRGIFSLPLTQLPQRSCGVCAKKGTLQIICR